MAIEDRSNHEARMTSATRWRQDEGFTLVEMLVVMAIMALLAVVSTPQVLKYLGRARIDAARTQIRNFESALELYYIDVGAYPPPEAGLKALFEKPDGVESWAGPYLRGDGNLVDPWGHAYVYDQPEGDKPFQIRSLGRDGRPGGEGQDADISG